MNQAFEIGAVGLSGQQKALDTIAGNVANVSTPGFKRGVVRFSEILSTVPDAAQPGASLTQAPALAGVAMTAGYAIESQGEIAHTGNSLDLAIDGAGFIELMSPAGRTLLWRGGQLGVKDGFLSTADGLALRSMVSVPEDALELRIDASGSVTARLASGDVANLGEISLVRVEDPARLVRLDGGFYSAPDDVVIIEARPGETGFGHLVQGGIEQSNVNLNDEMVQLMVVQRAYAANAQIIQAADQLAAIANNLKE